MIGIQSLTVTVPVELIVNGQKREIRTSATVADLVRELEIGVPHFAIAVNHDIVAKSKYQTTTIKDGDQIEIVHAVGGGV
jgi:thiamine biosynthesis protein ThiS